MPPSTLAERCSCRDDSPHSCIGLRRLASSEVLPAARASSVSGTNNAADRGMPVMFPTLQFFTTLQETLSTRSDDLELVEPSDAYCGLGMQAQRLARLGFHRL